MEGIVVTSIQVNPAVARFKQEPLLAEQQQFELRSFALKNSVCSLFNELHHLLLELTNHARVQLAHVTLLPCL